MIRSLFTSATGMQAQEMNIDVISNNLANVNTTGYKKALPTFQDLFYQTVSEPGNPTSQINSNPTGIQVGLGVKTASVQKIFSQGDLQNTNNPLDVAIEGDGFFEVLQPDGTIAYTRAGNFRLDQQGQIVNVDGLVINPGITIPPDATQILIGKNGLVQFKQAGVAAPTDAGQFVGVRFPNNSGLKSIGQNLFVETLTSGTPVQGIFNEQGFGRVSQGFLESSNVSVVEQVVNMITAQRAYEASSKGITTSDEMLSQAINLKR
jgi:flagellar basal-body rod protein FlgG